MTRWERARTVLNVLRLPTTADNCALIEAAFREVLAEAPTFRSEYFSPLPDVHATVNVTVGGETFPGCAWCGHVMPRGGWKSKCKGRVKVALR